jgi:hypothetical protein
MRNEELLWQSLGAVYESSELVVVDLRQASPGAMPAAGSRRRARGGPPDLGSYESITHIGATSSGGGSISVAMHRLFPPHGGSSVTWTQGEQGILR